jgi:hypothetical protein
MIDHSGWLSPTGEFIERGEDHFTSLPPNRAGATPSPRVDYTREGTMRGYSRLKDLEDQMNVGCFAEKVLPANKSKTRCLTAARRRISICVGNGSHPCPQLRETRSLQPEPNVEPRVLCLPNTSPRRCYLNQFSGTRFT